MSQLKEKRRSVVAKASQMIADAKSIITLNYKGLAVPQLNALYTVARKHNVEMLVIKNTLARIALKDTPYQQVANNLNGQTVFAFSLSEPAAAAQAFRHFKKEYGIALIATNIALSGNLMEVGALDKLADMPTREQAIARLIACLQAPITRLQLVITEPIRRLVVCLREVGISRTSL